MERVSLDLSRKARLQGLEARARAREVAAVDMMMDSEKAVLEVEGRHRGLHKGHLGAITGAEIWGNIIIKIPHLQER